MTEKHIEEKLNKLLEHIDDQECQAHYFRLISTLLEKGYFPGLAEVPVVKSSISHIDGERGILMYRGYPAEELAENCSFEGVCYLILNGDLPLASEEEELRQNHIHRLNQGKCWPGTGVVYVEMLSNLQRVAAHSASIAMAVLEEGEE